MKGGKWGWVEPGIKRSYTRSSGLRAPSTRKYGQASVAFIHLYLSACTLEGAHRSQAPGGICARCSALLPPKVVNVTQFAAAWMIHINRRRRRPSAHTFSTNGSWTSSTRERTSIPRQDFRSYVISVALVRSWLSHFYTPRKKKTLDVIKPFCSQFATWCASDARVQVSRWILRAACVSVCDTLRPLHTLICTHFC